LEEFRCGPRLDGAVIEGEHRKRRLANGEGLDELKIVKSEEDAYFFV
jgi:hypothetical protein